MDHIIELPDSKGFDAILIVVCHLTKQALFMPCHTTNNAPEFAELFLKHIFFKHRLLNNIISDYGPLFVSHFWKLLCKVLKMKTNLFTTYHPETNRQMEQCAELPLAKFTYNNMPHSTTGVSSFYANKGYNPQLTLFLKDSPSHITHKVAKDLQSLHQFLQNKINTVNQAYSKHANA
ncbi:hypothetical protein E4T56_gene1029 [Termitomyces sp. T112]|nr:hypothetical protein E4T56_gene1029 [Termitomyces sp. T112]